MANKSYSGLELLVLEPLKAAIDKFDQESLLMKIESVTLREIHMPLLFRFETSFGETTSRKIILAEIKGEGSTGWGEVTCGEAPFYNEEDTDIAWHVMKDFAIPRLLSAPVATATEAWARWEPIRGHRMAIGGLETALWDLEAKLAGRSVSSMIGGTLSQIPCGVSIGIQPSAEALIARIETELASGYQRIKIKIKPEYDIEVIEKVREKFPRLQLMADANSAYTLADVAHLKQLDRFFLMMIEQPLAHDDIIDHARLQQSLQTPICLDESIRTLRHAQQAIEMGACQIINIKLGRVGGYTQARQIHEYCQSKKVPVWCGGMLESGIGRAHNVALSSLAGFVLPGDVAASKRYWKQDIITPAVEVTPNGTIHVPQGPGIGYEPDVDLIDQLTVRRETVKCRTS